MSRSIYIYIFEDNTIRWDFISPTDLDLRCWGKGFISILRIDGMTDQSLMELIDTPDTWQNIEQADLINDEQGEYHNL